MLSDIEIARSVKALPITEVAAKLGVRDEEVECYGKNKAKLDLAPRAAKGKLILVTAINPTPYGEGKTTVSIGLADGLAAIGENVCLALREPSLGPVFGLKGGATGGGRAQVIPMEEINLHFNGDFHAITTANNLLSAMIDNHIKQGLSPEIDPARVEWKRCMDMNDRALREIECGLGGEINGTPRKDGFNITAASEIMAILCLSKDLADMKRRLGNILVGYSTDGKAVYASDIHAADAMAISLKEALKPNLVQTLEGTPAIIHGGPFANIAHGCNSVIATKAALSLADFVVTEAGFGADLGAEKFFDIKCRLNGLDPDCVVLVATCRSLKYNGGVGKDDIGKPNLAALKVGSVNMLGHIENIRNVFGKKVVVAVNKFVTDSPEELDFILSAARAAGAEAVVCEGWEKGGAGCECLAKTVASAVRGNTAKLRFSYDLDMSVEDKIEAVATKIYGAKNVVLSDAAKAKIKEIESLGFRNYPVCIAKTQYSFSQDATKLGRPTGYEFFVRDIEIRAGAEFLVVVAGNIMLMPGLPKVPAAAKMKIEDDGTVYGLF